MYRKLLFLSLLSASFATMMAIPAWNKPITHTQPDGSTIEIVRHGDEHFHYTTLANGDLITKGADGFFYYAEVSDSGIQPTAYKVGDNVPVQKHIKSAAATTAIEGLRRSALQRYAVGVKQAKPRANTMDQQHGLVVLVEFSDMKMKRTQQDYINMLNQEGYSDDKATGSARDYFHDTSYGKYNPTFDVYGPYTVEYGYQYYGRNNSDGDDSHATDLVVEACRLASRDTDLSAYDYDGDGYIDDVFVFYAGEGEANSENDDAIWPHRWYVVPDANFDGDPDVGGVKVYGYACSNEICKSNSTKIGTDLEGVGTFLHEFGHVLGFSDHYSTNSNNNVLDPGFYDVMASGSYLNYGRSPVAYNSYERMYQGWLTPAQIHPSFEGDNITLGTIDSGEALLLTDDGSTHNMNGVEPSPATYYLLECRNAEGWDYYSGYDGRYGGKGDSGLLITKIQYDSLKWADNTVNANGAEMGITYVCNSVQKSSLYTYYPMFPGHKVQTSVSFGSYTIKKVQRDATTGAVSFTISDSNGESKVADTEAETAKAIASKGCIKIEGEPARTTVYNATGQCVYQGTDQQIAVAAGVYIVSIGGRTQKVMVY